VKLYVVVVRELGVSEETAPVDVEGVYLFESGEVAEAWAARETWKHDDRGYLVFPDVVVDAEIGAQA